jgi:hypothetical protein
MGWITEKLPNGKTQTYWLPDTLPENTEQWRRTQISKRYLNPENEIRLHPGWLYSNGALVCDEYFYRNYEWKRIIDEKPDDRDEEGNIYAVSETPTSEWESVDEYTIRKVYKKFLFSPEEGGTKPEWRYNKIVNEHRVYDDENMTFYDVYTISDISDEEVENTKNKIIKKIRAVRNELLNKTDYLVVISKEKNKELTSDFLNYRQNLRDITDQVDTSQMSEHTLNGLISIDENNVDKNIDEYVARFNYFPELPDNIFLE